jgi:hypothetical protein
MERHIIPLTGVYVAVIAASSLYRSVTTVNENYKFQRGYWSFYNSMSDAAAGLIVGFGEGVLAPVTLPLAGLAWIGRQL